MNVETMGIVIALRPRYDMRRPQERWIGDSGHWASTAPVGQQSFPEDSLTNTLHDQAFGFRGARHAGSLLRELLQRCVG